MMAFAHADHYPVMTDNARMSDDKPVHLAPDLRTDDRRVGSNNRQKSRSMSGRNSTEHLKRVGRLQVR